MLSSIIWVDYKCVDGHHVFTSESVKGLLVVNEDVEVAYRDVAPSIKKLLEINNEVDCDIRPSLPFKDFVASIESEEERAGHRIRCIASLSQHDGSP